MPASGTAHTGLSFSVDVFPRPWVTATVTQAKSSSCSSIPTGRSAPPFVGIWKPKRGTGRCGRKTNPARGQISQTSSSPPNGNSRGSATRSRLPVDLVHLRGTDGYHQRLEWSADREWSATVLLRNNGVLQVATSLLGAAECEARLL